MNSGWTIQELIDLDHQRSQLSSTTVSSGFSTEELRQVIADAKEVRQTALRNARQALEDAFSHRFEKAFAKELEGLSNG